MKWRFALVFLATFTVLVPLWWQLDLGHHYRDAVLLAVRWTSPLVTGWWLDWEGGSAAFRRDRVDLPFLLNLPAIAWRCLPLISFVAPAPVQGVRRSAVLVPLAVALYFGVDVAVVLAYPTFMHEPGRVADTIGVFAGMVAFVVAPLGIWFAVTYPSLRSLWQIDPAAGDPRTVPGPRATRRERRS